MNVGNEQPSAGSPRALKPHELRELQKIELGILLDVQATCERLGLRFYLGEGTLLGAIRHNGFIPWDDDVDLLMPRADFDRFVSEAPRQLGERYAVQHASTVPGFWSPLIKVRLIDKSTPFSQSNIAHLTDQNGPLVDIFPLDYVPKNHGLALHLQSLWVRGFRSMLVLCLGVKPATTPLRRLSRLLGRIFGPSRLHRALALGFTAHRHKGQLPYLANFGSYRPLPGQVLPRDVYGQPGTVTFENHLFPAPHQPLAVLAANYGDYRTPIPPKDGTDAHEFVVRR